LLEAELGVRLLQRSSRKVTLTEAGSAFHRRAAVAFAALEEAETAATDAHAALSGTIRISAPVEVGARLLEPLISRFLGEHPEVRVDVVLTARFVDIVEEGFDLAIRGGPVRDESLIARKIGREDAALFAAPAYLEAHGRPRSVAALARHACVLFRPSGGRATWSLVGPRGVESVEVAGRVGADHFSYIVGSVVRGLGVGLLPLFLCKDQVSEGALVRVLPQHVDRGTDLHLVYASARYLPRRVAVLRDALLEGLSRR
jgi:DNA-binding transcriptional LysR family regulator